MLGVLTSHREGGPEARRLRRSAPQTDRYSQLRAIREDLPEPADVHPARDRIAKVHRHAGSSDPRAEKPFTLPPTSVLRGNRGPTVDGRDRGPQLRGDLGGAEVGVALLR